MDNRKAVPVNVEVYDFNIYSDDGDRFRIVATGRVLNGKGRERVVTLKFDGIYNVKYLSNGIKGLIDNKIGRLNSKIKCYNESR